MSDLRVCIFTETFYPVVGGGETQARLLAEGLISHGIRVIIITRRSQRSLQSIERFGEITVYRLPPIGSQHLKKWGLLFSSIPHLVRLRHEYDLIFVSGFRVIGVSAVLVSKLFGKTCVLKADNNGEMSGMFFTAGMEKYGFSPESFLFRVLLAGRNKFLKGANRFAAISTDIRNELISQGVAPSKIALIPNSVDTSIYRPVDELTKLSLREKLCLPPGMKIIIYSGRLVSYKGLSLLLKVWRQILEHYSDILLLLVGSGSLDIHNCEEELRNYVHSNELSSTVIFAGEVQNVHEYLQASDIFVFPTEKEAFGISLIEAMACGLPVISTDVGGLKDIIIPGQNGLQVAPGDFEQLYEAMRILISDNELSARLEKAACETVEQRFSNERVTKNYMMLFRGVSAVLEK
ncbi:MAG: glycosyltransferase family 4 protein [Anaerolineales bacterium]|jgi:glycosyltransferase involved in cell wall biosynthesis